MLPDRVKAGTSFAAYMDFYDDNNNPLVMIEPVSYEVRDEARSLILQGITQQSNQAQRWGTNISIPQGAIPGPYSIKWFAKTKDSKEAHVEHFTVTDPTPNYYELDQLLPEMSILSDNIKVGRGETVSSAHVRVLTPDGIAILDEAVDTQPVVSGSKQYVQFTSDGPVSGLLAGDSIFAMYVVVWTFLLDGLPQTEYHFIYVANYKSLMYVRELNRMIDKARIQHPNPNLRYNEVDLVAYLNMGLQWLNAQPPTQTSWTITTVPQGAYTYLLASAAYEALSSRYLAEGEAAFNFSGQPITLEVDRTGFIESALGRYETRMQEFANVKRSIIMSSGGGVGSASGGGVLLLSTGPTLDFNPFGQNSRSPYYQNWINNYTGYVDAY